MKTFVKTLSALVICGTFLFVNFDTAEAAEVADLNNTTIQTQELAHHYPPPPPPPPRHHKPHHHKRHHMPPPPPPPHHMPPPPPHRGW